MNVLSKLGLLLLLGSAACVSAGQHKAAVADDSADKLTVGKVQKEIRVGMSGADVVQALGSPNIVTTDEKSREVWVYDKLSTETAYSSTQGGATILVLGVGGSAGATSRTQKTLTVVIKFDKKSRVEKVTYHSSRF